jgi:hypothetical protein
MSFTLVDVAGANFRTDDDSDRLNTDFMGRLGRKARYVPARIAIARSLAIPSNPPALPEGLEAGRSIKGDTLFGTGSALAAWTALVVERSGSRDLAMKSLQDLIAAHWRRGLHLLDEDWRTADADQARFVRRLVEAADLPLAVKVPGIVEPTGAPQGPIIVPVGEIAVDANTGDQIAWGVNVQGGSPDCAVMGGVGSGKTRTAVAILRSIRSLAGVPLIAFDFKGDLASFYHLDQTYNATVIHPPRQAVPLNVLALNSREPIDIAFAAERFRESFGRLKGNKLGDRQRDAVFEAAQRALRNHDPCRLSNIRDSLRIVYGEREMKEDGAISTLNDLCRFPLFEPVEGPEDFFRGSWLVSLPPDVPETARGIVVNLILDALDRYLNSLPEALPDAEGNRPLRILCVIDEAHRILGTKLPGLSALIRQSRSKGGSVTLISQSPDDFSGEDDEFLNEMGLVVAFATNARPAAAGRILGRGVNLAALGAGECYVKRRGDATATRVVAWRRS